LGGDFGGRTANQRNGQRADEFAEEVDIPHLRIHDFEAACVICSNENCVITPLARDYVVGPRPDPRRAFSESGSDDEPHG
jgi:hypothetical protein